MEPRIVMCWNKNLTPIEPKEGDLWFPSADKAGVYFRTISDENPVPEDAVELSKEDVDFIRASNEYWVKRNMMEGLKW